MTVLPAHPAAVSPVVLIGFGPWGRNIARNLEALGALAGICDPDPAARDAAAHSHPHTARYASADDVPAHCAVAIAAPAAQHASLVAFFLRRGQHVFVEKPLALRVDECAPLVELARQQARVLMVGHLLHHHPAVQALDRLIRDGALGRLQYLYSNRLNLGRFRREENSLWSFAPHDIAVMLRLVGHMPARVSANGGCYLHAQIADTTVTHLSWPDGVQAHIYVSWLHPFKEQRLVVVGDQGMAVFDDQQPHARKLLLYRHAVDWRDGAPQPRKADAEPIDLPHDEPLRREMEVFLAACADPRLPVVADGAEGTRVLTVLDAAQRSLQTQGSPVDIGPAKATGDWQTAGVRVHPSATVDPRAQIGSGTAIWHYAHVMHGAQIGRDCVLGQNVFVQQGAMIGDRVRIQNNVSVYDGVKLGDGVFCGPSCVFTNVTRPRAHVSRKHAFDPTPVGEGATLGANSTIVCGHRVGAWAFVAAGAVVTRDVPDHALVAGNPARIRGWVCRCGEKLDLPAHAEAHRAVACPACQSTWQLRGQQLVATSTTT